MKKIVQICSFRSIYNDTLQARLIENKSIKEQADVVAIYIREERKCFEKEFGIEKYSKLDFLHKLIYNFRFSTWLSKKFKFNKKEDIANIQYVHRSFVFLIPFLNRNFKKTVLSFWGSDLLKQDDITLRMMGLLFRCSDAITFETKEVQDIFSSKVGNHFCEKYRIVRFGISQFEIIDNISSDDCLEFKRKYDIPKDRPIVVIGYNRVRNHQHIAVIQSLIKYNVDKKVFLIFPWTYGEDDANYRKQIEYVLNGMYDYCFITEHLTDNEIGALRCITDVLIQVQITDSLSASMLETLYSEKFVITGSWLPYGELIEEGVFLNLVDSVEECGKILKELVVDTNHTEELRRNKQIVFDMSGWTNNINKWIALYE